jgi:hypothetical protein
VILATATCIEHRLHGPFALEGKDTVSLDQLIRLLNRDPSKQISHLPGPLARLIGPMMGIRRDFVEIFLDDQLSTDPNVFDVCGLVPKSIQYAWG